MKGYRRVKQGELVRPTDVWFIPPREPIGLKRVFREEYVTERAYSAGRGGTWAGRPYMAAMYPLFRKIRTKPARINLSNYRLVPAGEFIRQDDVWSLGGVLMTEKDRVKLLGATSCVGIAYLGTTPLFRRLHRKRR